MLNDLFWGGLGLAAGFLRSLIEFGADFGRVAVFGAILVAVCAIIVVTTDPITRRLEQTARWRAMFGFRHSFWDVAIPAMIAAIFAGMVLVVALGYATGRLPAR